MRDTRLPDESQEYLSKREALRTLEIESMKLRERVAESRRQLPPGPAVKDYMFLEGPADLNAEDTPTRTVHLSELFSGPGRSVVIYHLMYGKEQSSPCPMCSLWIDGYNGVAGHIAQNIDFAVVAAPTRLTCAPTPDAGAGTICGCSAPVRAALLNTTLTVKTRKAIRNRPSRYSRATSTARCVISIPPTRGWTRRSSNEASI